ncbi:LysR family transcriptional regulator [Cupriavidus alkaliphilus]|uniref:LysR substrate-binding domain-containing protein n=1 Tax=Cupriavidus alkaliphilus TaxID=942866 RepID=UPI003144ED0B
MDLRHFQCFLVVAEELHFSRAAERLHMEQSPLSRAIKELEEDLGVQLLVRTTRSTRLTRAGHLFLEHVRRIFAAVEQARDSIQSGAMGFHDQLRIALSEISARQRLPALLALCRQEDPEVALRLFDVPLSQQIRGLHDDVYDVGFSLTNEVGNGVIAHPLWSEPLVVAIPARHPLLAYRQIPLEELARYPLALCDPQTYEGQTRAVDRLLRRLEQEPRLVDRVSSFDLMMTLVSAGLALGLGAASHIAVGREWGVVARPLAGRESVVTTYLLRTDAEPSQTLARFIERASAVEPAAFCKPANCTE